jgi:hypothetical protein
MNVKSVKVMIQFMAQAVPVAIGVADPTMKVLAIYQRIFIGYGFFSE